MRTVDEQLQDPADRVEDGDSPGTGGTGLPGWDSVLAVVAHPDDESFGLGAVLSGLADAGAEVSVLCLTRGEASTLHGVPGDLTALRAGELTAAAQELGVGDVTLLTHPDGALADVDTGELAEQVVAIARRSGAQALVGFDLSGVSGHPDHVAATQVAVQAADVLGIPVLGWTLPVGVARQLREEYGAPFDGHEEVDVDVVLPVDRERQLRAVRCHASQAVPGSVLWRRLELLGDTEHLRWLRR
ncbi:PIG-L deacetylase family protein [Ornithinimicrobium sp. W1665]|uniref:PIG-L deacetylase family protein n=1 Tax=Ornithinimicrobium sp. W1665 TaxID=3416666 RepID=UPI003D6B1B66